MKEQKTENHATAEGASWWHSVDDELPPVGETVIIWYYGKYRYAEIRKENGKSIWCDCYGQDFALPITYWMPLQAKSARGSGR